MSPRQWAALGFRILAIYQLFAIALELPYYAIILTTSDDTVAFAWSGAANLVWRGLAAWVLLVYTEWFVDRVFRPFLPADDANKADSEADVVPGEERTAPEPARIGRDDILAIALAVAGVIMLADVAPDLFLRFLTLVDETDFPVRSLYEFLTLGWSPAPWTVVIVKTILGLVLLLRSYGIVRLWVRGQEMSLRRPRPYGIGE